MSNAGSNNNKTLLDITVEHSRFLHTTEREGLIALRQRGRIVLGAILSTLVASGGIITTGAAQLSHLIQFTASTIDRLVTPSGIPGTSSGNLLQSTISIFYLLVVPAGSALLVLAFTKAFNAALKYIAHREEQGGVLRVHTSFAGIAEHWTHIQPSTLSVSGRFLFESTIQELGYNWWQQFCIRHQTLHRAFKRHKNNTKYAMRSRLDYLLCVVAHERRTPSPAGILVGGRSPPCVDILTSSSRRPYAS